MSSSDGRAQFYWLRHTDGDGRWNTRVGRRQPEGPPGADLAALRRGLNREPGSVPAMWPFYTQTNPEGNWTPEFQAEHDALTLFAIHQQSNSRPMHRTGIGLGKAVLALRQYGEKDAPDTDEAATHKIDWTRVHPVDRRFSAAATAADMNELVMHLRGLVRQLNDIGQPLDYTQLFKDLCQWQRNDGPAVVRRRWGMQYFTRSKFDADEADSQSNNSTTFIQEEAL